MHRGGEIHVIELDPTVLSRSADEHNSRGLARSTGRRRGEASFSSYGRTAAAYAAARSALDYVVGTDTRGVGGGCFAGHGSGRELLALTDTAANGKRDRSADLAMSTPLSPPEHTAGAGKHRDGVCDATSFEPRPAPCPSYDARCRLNT